MELANLQAPTIVAVDDSRSVGKFLMEHFMTTGFDVFIYRDPIQALKEIESRKPDLILLDIVMPEMDGFELCVKLKEIPSLVDVPVLFLSGSADTANIVKGFLNGAVDFIEKPIVFEVLLARIRTHLKLFRLQKIQVEANRKLEDLVSEKINQLHQSQLGTILALAKLAESRDTDTGQHLERVEAFCELLASVFANRKKETTHPEVNQWYITLIKYSSALHDIGKVSIPDAVLLKPGKLDAHEFEIMKTHSLLGAATLQQILEKNPDNSFIEMGYQIALCHHEKWDGTGYPNGLKGSQIPLSARIMAIADVYDALRSERCYKKGFTHEQAYAIIEESSGSHFDPELVDVFIEFESKFNEIWDSKTGNSL